MNKEFFHHFSGNFYIEGQGIVRCSCTVADKKFVAFGAYDEKNALPDKMLVVPGFIDKHIHGAGGYDCSFDSFRAVQKMAELLPQEGVTRFLPTTMTAPKEDTERALEGIAGFRKEQTSGARVEGIHLEGPFISPKKVGAQPKEDVLPFDERYFEKLYDLSDRSILQVTYAPEENPSMTRYLFNKGIVASVGHTDGSCDQILYAERAGATSVTHTFNAMSALSHRDCGALGGVFLANDMWCELICDKIHVQEEAIRILYKVQRNKIVLVTDATAGKYAPGGQCKLGKNNIIVSGGVARLEDGTIAGSVVKMNDAVRNFMKVCHATFVEAIDSASLRPAKCLGIDDKVGSIALGKLADFVVIDDNVNVYQTIVEGILQ